MADLYAPDVACLSNGLQVFSVERPASNTFAASLVVRAGSNDDPHELPGLAHAVEHVSFAGANRQLAKMLTSNGAQLNAQTGSEVTAWFVSGHVDQLNVALQFFANVLVAEPLTAAQLNSEKRILSHEYATGEVTHRAKALSSYYAKVFGIANMPGDRRLRKRLRKITPEAVLSFQQQHFHAANARLAIVAPASSSSLGSALLHYLGSDTPPRDATYQTRTTHQRERVTKIYADGFRYVWLFSSHVVSNTSPQMRLVAEIIYDILGGGPHSDLFRGLRDERSLAYDVGAWSPKHLTSTAVTCHSTVDRRSALVALRLMLERENKIARDGLTENQFEDARARLRRHHEMSLDHPRGLSRYLAYEALRDPEDQLLSASELIATLKNLSIDDANRNAKELLAPKNRSVFVGGKLWMLGRWRVGRLIRELNAE